jgi:hypothetical protein
MHPWWIFKRRCCRRNVSLSTLGAEPAGKGGGQRFGPDDAASILPDRYTLPVLLAAENDLNAAEASVVVLLAFSVCIPGHSDPEDSVST